LCHNWVQCCGKKLFVGDEKLESFCGLTFSWVRKLWKEAIWVLRLWFWLLIFKSGLQISKMLKSQKYYFREVQLYKTHYFLCIPIIYLLHQRYYWFLMSGFPYQDSYTTGISIIHRVSYLTSDKPHMCTIYC